MPETFQKLYTEMYPVFSHMGAAITRLASTHPSTHHIDLQCRQEVVPFDHFDLKIEYDAMKYQYIQSLTRLTRLYLNDHYQYLLKSDI